MDDNGLEKIEHNGKLVAIIIKKEFSSDDVIFFSPPDFSQQLGYISYKKDHNIKSHFHLEVKRKITLTQEALFVRKGRIQVDLYTEDKEFITSRELKTGDLIFLCSGGHGFKMLEDSEMIEVKQGPYSGKQSDKETFEV